MNYIKPICLFLIAIGVIVIFVKRAKRRTVTYREIEDWAKSICVRGDTCYLSILAKMPSEVRNSVRKHNGITQIVNGYKENSSIYVTIMDADNNIKRTSFFMGKSLDKELIQAFSNAVIHSIKF